MYVNGVLCGNSGGQWRRVMRIDYMHRSHPDWYGSIVPCSRPGMYWAHTDNDSVSFPTLGEAQRYMRRKRYIPAINELEIFLEEARHVA